MQGSLVDNEGFPRADIDIYAVRTARNKIICKKYTHTLSSHTSYMYTAAVCCVVFKVYVMIIRQ